MRYDATFLRDLRLLLCDDPTCTTCAICASEYITALIGHGWSVEDARMFVVEDPLAPYSKECP